MLKITSYSPVITRKIGAQIAKQIAQNEVFTKEPIFILLEGNLGAGKTTFTMGFLNYFGIKPSAASPTFVIAKHYHIYHTAQDLSGSRNPRDTKYGKNTKVRKSEIRNPTSEVRHPISDIRPLISDIWHIDAYRLKSKKDLELIGFSEMNKQSRTAIVMEWPGNVRGLKLKNVITIGFEYGKAMNERNIFTH